MTPQMKSLVALNRAYKNYSNLKAQMVGQLYPSIIESRYLLPIRVKLSQLKYHPEYKDLDFSEAYRIVHESK